MNLLENLAPDTKTDVHSSFVVTCWVTVVDAVSVVVVNTSVVAFVVIVAWRSIVVTVVSDTVVISMVELCR